MSTLTSRWTRANKGFEDEDVNSFLMFFAFGAKCHAGVFGSGWAAQTYLKFHRNTAKVSTFSTCIPHIALVADQIMRKIWVRFDLHKKAETFERRGL